MRVFRTMGRRGAAAAALSLGVMVALITPATQAVGESSPPLTLGMRIESPARPLAFGAALTVPVDVVCPAGLSSSVNVSVAERVLFGLASGSGYSRVVCTGTNQRVDVYVQAVGRAFIWGRASVVGSAYVWDGDAYATATDQATVWIIGF